MKIFIYICKRELMPSRFSSEFGEATRREHYILEAFANALFWPLEPENFERASQNIAEVDATGRYLCYPVGVLMANLAIMHTFGYTIYQRRGV